jgi:hypothetical protein
VRDILNDAALRPENGKLKLTLDGYGVMLVEAL